MAGWVSRATELIGVRAIYGRPLDVLIGDAIRGFASDDGGDIALRGGNGITDDTTDCCEALNVFGAGCPIGVNSISGFL